MRAEALISSLEVVEEPKYVDACGSSMLAKGAVESIALLDPLSLNTSWCGSVPESGWLVQIPGVQLLQSQRKVPNVNALIN